jgi:hypothetical protein
VRYRCYRFTWTWLGNFVEGSQGLNRVSKQDFHPYQHAKARCRAEARRDESTSREPPRSVPGLPPVPPVTEMPNSNSRCSDLSMRAADYGRCMVEISLTASLAIEHPFSLRKGCQTVTMACCYYFLLSRTHMPTCGDTSQIQNCTIYNNTSLMAFWRTS